MASRRPGPQACGWPSNTGPRDQQASAGTPKEAAKITRWKTRREPEASHQSARAIPQPIVSSRLPQPLSHRRPSDSQPDQPRLTQRPRVRNSIGSSSGLGVGEPVRPLPSASSRLPAPSLKPRNLLGQKRSGRSQDTGNTPKDSQNDLTGPSSSDSYPRSQTPLDILPAPHLDRGLTQSPMEIRIAHQVEIPRTKAQTVTIYPELDRYRDDQPPFWNEGFDDSNLAYRLSTHDLPPPTPLFSGTSSQVSGFSGSPSTRWSESPGPGPYSRDTTPTSMSSQSPGLVAPMRIPPPPGSRIRQPDSALTRPPVTRRRTGSVSNDLSAASADPQGLAVVRELSTSSSSNSTVRAGGNLKEKKRGKGQPQRPPSPPPRKSSQKPKGGRSETVSHTKPSRETPQPQVALQPPAKGRSHSRPLPVQAAQPAASNKPTPPMRPSRDGTVDLQAQSGHPLTVIRSNLSTTSLSERRQSGSLVPGPISSSLPDQPNYLSQRPPAREPTPAPTSATSRPTRTPSPASTFKTRFPIFGRRTKTVPEPSQPEKKERPARKGPAAGTGHEGYGRLGLMRRRSNSVANTARVIPGTMSSQESFSSSHSYDPFLMERMAPVIIAGGEIIENRNTSAELTRTESNQSSTLRRPSIESRNSSQVSLSTREASRKTLWPSPFPRVVKQAPSLNSRRPSESSDSEAPATRPTLALRRSTQRLKSGDQEPRRLAKPIVIRHGIVSPSVTSLDASIMSDDSMFNPSLAPAVASKEPAGTATLSGSKKPIERARSPRKWNFFGRSQNQPAAEKKADTTRTVAATVQVVQSKPVAFYTIMDSSEQDESEPVDLDDVLREARGMPAASERPSVDGATTKRPSVTQDGPPVRQGRFQQADHQPMDSIRVATAPVPSAAKAKPAVTSILPPGKQPPPPSQPRGRPSRLPQVGRIPKVVSARTEQISPKSFSRPFHRLSVHMPPTRPDLQDADSIAKGPSPPEPSTPEPAYDDPATTGVSNISALIYGVPRLSPPVYSQPGHEFLSFSPRKGSQGTTTTTSSSSGGFLVYTDATAVVPEPNAPLAEDEIWDEYNDLLGEDTMRLSASQGPRWPKPLRLGESRGKLIAPALESPTLIPPPLPSLVQALRAGMEHPSSDSNGSGIAEEVRRMLESGPAPASPVIATDAAHSQDSQVHNVNIRKQTEESESSQRASNSSGDQTRRSNVSGSSQCSDASSPLSQVNLRVGSMTVSKWLTFGHVLFSPVRDDLVPVVGSLKRPSILVIDGLGNDDWSFYAAETYPAATFFNLSPRAPLPAEYQGESSIPPSPPNHHQVQYLSPTEKFPFGAQSFTAVVIRFPISGPEGHYRSLVSEARRVLKPGGYLELSILDLDLNNMGNRCRRSVRRLKERIRAEAPETSLASTSDLILRLIGRRGFTDVKTCRVGVPVASNIARSPGRRRISTGGKRGSISAVVQEKSKLKRDERSLPEMINDDGPMAYESIAKSVAKVGRWWYHCCYESAAGPGPQSSMWNDKALLSECQEWGTSLKLMVCHARVPDGKARVASI
ncbi:hypothetical protein BT67DRAFT_12947 [Trichocladium antarcticum]|uniref:Methyltransferase type 11 domain-containing protein n=1 Tax=Trichocladium antarcticum TaxID=1450529 RepID=A0AAN6USQ0_9PEZI|nr:hypothetical protein BT67DRAFT_12947 [Trichocladium antarcticum]